MNKILNCPFCGGEAESKNRLYCEYVDDLDFFWVECKVCKAKSKEIKLRGARYHIETVIQDFKEAEQKAIEQWNTRKPMEMIKEELKEIIPLIKTGNFCGKRDEFGECDNKECWECVVENAIEIVEKGGME